MEPEEVRIGNLVLILSDNSSIPSGYPGFIKAITRAGEFDFTKPEHDEPVIIPAEHCAGIEIEHQWLVLNGFEHHKEQSLYGEGNVKLQYFEDINAYRFYLLENVINRPIIKYIHEFQNSCLILYGFEFDVKVSPYTP